MDSGNLKKIFLRLLLISVGASAFAGIFIFLFGEFRETEVKILLTTLSIGGCSLTGLCSSAIYSTRSKIFGLVGMAISAGCFVFILISIWVDTKILFNNWRVMESMIVVSFSIAHISLLLIQPVTNKSAGYMLNATLIGIGIVAILLILLINGVFERVEFFYRVLGVFAILDVAGTVATLVLSRMKKAA